MHYVLGAHSPGLKWLGREVDTHFHLVPRSRIQGGVPPLLQYIFMEQCVITQWIHFRGVYLVKHRENFTFTLPYIYIKLST
jgi:hypothetical protein